MPKVRQTCTRCSMRRQKCDRKSPCTRCIQNNEASSCSREWQDGYDPLLHRTYPKCKAVQPSDHNVPSGLTSSGVRRQDRSLAQNVTLTQESYSPHPIIHHTTNATASQPLSNVRQAAPDDFQPSRSTDETTSSGFLENNSERSSGLVPSNTPPLMNQHFSAENAAAGHGYAWFGALEIEKQNIQTLVPTNLQISRLVEYHEKCLLWYHGCVHGPTFQMELNKALQGSDGFQFKCLDLQWSALLFSIMAASLTCTSDSVAKSWGFSKAQKRYLSKQWYEASIACLHLGDYTSKLSIYSIQAIQVLSMSAHINGFSDKQFVIFGTALRVAQNLGLQRLAPDPELDTFPANEDGVEISLSRKDILIRRELGRRIWMQICIQDWFSIPSSDMYFINKQHFTTSRPRRVNDQDMTLAEDQVPVATDSGNILYNIASLMADFHDSIIVLSDPAAKYDQVLKYDSRMRALCTQSKAQIAENPEISWPQWVRWTRGVASIVQAHKIIMIHRSFLCKSFTDPRYTYTRWASIAASKTILLEAEIAIADVERPAFWHDQVRSKPDCLRTCPQVAMMTLCFIDIVYSHMWLVQVLLFVLIYYIARSLSQNSWNTKNWLIRLSPCSRDMTIAH